jgi:hypothetical protein
MVLTRVADQPLKSSGSSDSPTFQGDIEMPHAVTLLADPVKVKECAFSQ